MFEEKEIFPNLENIDQEEAMKWDMSTEQEQQEKDEQSQRDQIPKVDKDQKEEKKQDRGKEDIELDFGNKDVRGGNIFDKNVEKLYHNSEVTIKSVWTCRICGMSARGHLNHTCIYCFSPL